MQKDKENKGKFGLGFLTKDEDQVEKTPPVEGEEELSDSEEEEEAEEGSEDEEGEAEEEAPAWLELIEGSSVGDPCKVTDKELLKIKGIGKGTLEKIREIYPYEEPKRSGKVLIEVLPMRGIGGVGKAGAQAEMDWEQAEQYVRDGYVKILE